MNSTKICIALILLAMPGLVQAVTPVAMMQGYAARAEKSAPDFKPSAERGRKFFTHKWNVKHRMPSCSACHGTDLTQDGKHVITRKRIRPLSPRADADRFTDTRKAEKWFRRNCKEVVGRACTAAEKADLLKFFNNPGVNS